MKENEIKEYLWRINPAKYPIESSENFDVHGDNIIIPVGEIRTRKFGDLQLCRIRDGQKVVIDIMTTNDDEVRKAMKNYISKFRKARENAMQEFAEKEKEEFMQRGPPTFEIPSDWGPITARFLVDGEEVSPVWVGPNRLGVEVNYQIFKEGDSRFGKPDVVGSRSGMIEFGLPSYFEETLKIARGVLYRRMGAATTDPEFTNLGPLMKSTINAVFPVAAYPVMGPIVEMIINLPEKSKAIIEQRRRQLVGE